MPGASRTHSLMYEWKKYMCVVTTGKADQPTFPAQWFTTYRARSPPVSTILLVTVVAGIAFRDLTPAQGCQDHTPSPSAFVPHALRHYLRPLHSIPRFVAIATRPSYWDGTGGLKPLI
jgi:hypothetical protein